MPVNLTPLTKKVIAHFFAAPNASFIEQLLADECGNNLPLYTPSTPEGLERVWLAVLKIGNGNEDKLLEAVLLVKRDWRDVLVWADFANDLQAHKKWAEKLK